MWQGNTVWAERKNKASTSREVLGTPHRALVKGSLAVPFQFRNHYNPWCVQTHGKAVTSISEQICQLSQAPRCSEVQPQTRGGGKEKARPSHHHGGSWQSTPARAQPARGAHGACVTGLPTRTSVPVTCACACYHLLRWLSSPEPAAHSGFPSINATWH